MILYYGSKTLFEKPTFGVGNITNDYGLGFYLTPSFDSAKIGRKEDFMGSVMVKNC